MPPARVRIEISQLVGRRACTNSSHHAILARLSAGNPGDLWYVEQAMGLRLAVVVACVPAAFGRWPRPVVTACDEEGCDSTINADLGAWALQPNSGAEVTVCVDEVCEIRPSRARAIDVVSVNHSFEDEESVTVTVEITSSDGTAIVDASRDFVLKKIQPNGPDCGPTCYHAEVVLTPDGELANS